MRCDFQPIGSAERGVQARVLLDQYRSDRHFPLLAVVTDYYGVTGVHIGDARLGHASERAARYAAAIDSASARRGIEHFGGRHSSLIHNPVDAVCSLGGARRSARWLRTRPVAVR
jgi:hypothetical protein